MRATLQHLFAAAVGLLVGWQIAQAHPPIPIFREQAQPAAEEEPVPELKDPFAPPARLPPAEHVPMKLKNPFPDRLLPPGESVGHVPMKLKNPFAEDYPYAPRVVVPCPAPERAPGQPEEPFGRSSLQR